MSKPNLFSLQAITILERADAAEIGIQVKIENLGPEPIDNPTLRARQILYRFKKEFSPRFDNLTIRAAPHDLISTIWIIKTQPQS